MRAATSCVAAPPWISSRGPAARMLFAAVRIPTALAEATATTGCPSAAGGAFRRAPPGGRPTGDAGEDLFAARELLHIDGDRIVGWEPGEVVRIEGGDLLARCRAGGVRRPRRGDRRRRGVRGHRRDRRPVDRGAPDDGEHDPDLRHRHGAGPRRRRPVGALARMREGAASRVRLERGVGDLRLVAERERSTPGDLLDVEALHLIGTSSPGDDRVAGRIECVGVGLIPGTSA